MSKSRSIPAKSSARFCTNRAAAVSGTQQQETLDSGKIERSILFESSGCCHGSLGTHRKTAILSKTHSGIFSLKDTAIQSQGACMFAAESPSRLAVQVCNKRSAASLCKSCMILKAQSANPTTRHLIVPVSPVRIHVISGLWLGGKVGSVRGGCWFQAIRRVGRDRPY